MAKQNWIIPDIVPESSVMILSQRGRNSDGKANTNHICIAARDINCLSLFINMLVFTRSGTRMNFCLPSRLQLCFPTRLS